jgi:outer membrane receptor protein involved in Fe transport
VTINPSLYHQNSTNLFEISVSKNSSGYLVEKPINLGTENRYGIELNLTYSPINWWFISGDINWFKFEQKGLFNVNSNSWTSKVNSRIKLKTWSLQNSFNFEGAITSGQTKSKTQFWANLALSKEFWKEKASFTLRGDNIFDSRIDRTTISGSNYIIYAERRFSKPRVSLSFVYKFNRKKNDKDRLPE